MYGYELSTEIISNITSKIIKKANEWQSRPLEPIYPIIFMDATVLKIRVDRVVKNIAVYIMLGITLEGKKEIIGIWIGENETSKYWLTVLNDIQKLFEVCIMERQKSKCVWSDLFMGYV